MKDSQVAVNENKFWQANKQKHKNIPTCCSRPHEVHCEAFVVARMHRRRTEGFFKLYIDCIDGEGSGVIL